MALKGRSCKTALEILLVSLWVFNDTFEMPRSIGTSKVPVQLIPLLFAVVVVKKASFFHARMAYFMDGEVPMHHVAFFENPSISSIKLGLRLRATIDQ